MWNGKSPGLFTRENTSEDPPLIFNLTGATWGLQSEHRSWNKPVQIYARLVLLPRFSLSQHLVHYFFVARESVPWKNVKPAENQHAHAGPYRHLSPAASRQHLAAFLVCCRAAQNNRRVRVERGAAERILVSLLPLETITQSINGAPKLVRHCGVRIRLEIRFYVSEAMMERRAFGCGFVVQCVWSSVGIRRSALGASPQGADFRYPAIPLSLEPASDRDPAWRPPASRVHLRVLLQRSAAAGETSRSNSDPPPPFILSTPPSETKCSLCLSQYGPKRKMYKIKAEK